MNGSFFVALAVWVAWGAGTAYHAPKVLRRLVLITNCPPSELCDGCRDERRRVMLRGLEWSIFGDAAGVILVLAEAMGWFLKPFRPALRRAAGEEPYPTCSKGSCLAYTSRKATA